MSDYDDGFGYYEIQRTFLSMEALSEAKVG